MEEETDYTEYLKTHTITETLQKYQLTLKELITIQEQQYNTNTNTNNKQQEPLMQEEPTLPKYIMQTKHNTYQIKRKGTYYGTYKTLKQAIQIRNKLKEEDWDKNKLTQIQLQEGIIRYIIQL